MLLVLQQNNLLEAADSAPVFQGTIPNIFQRQNTGSYTYDLSPYFTGADSYAIAPSVESGWSFNTSSGVLIIDTDAIGNFGPFTVTASNAFGDTPSNAFYVEIASKDTGAGKPKKRRKRLLVEIDGQDFEVSSAEEAEALLEQARRIASKAIEKARKAPTKVNRGIPRPRISSPDAELTQVVQQAQEQIASLYDSYAMDLEIAALMRRRDEEREEEAILRFLM